MTPNTVFHPGTQAERGNQQVPLDGRAGDMLHGLQLPAMQTPEGEGRSHKILGSERKRNHTGWRKQAAGKEKT